MELNCSGTTLKYPSLSSIDIYVLTFLYTVIAIFGMVSNISIIIAVLSTKQLRKKQQFILLNIVVCDILTILVSAPYYIYSVNVKIIRKTELAVHMCKMYLYFSYALGYVSILSMLFISLDRYSAIVYPYLYHEHMTPKILRLCSALCWLIPALACFAPVVIDCWLDYDGKPGGICGVQWTKVDTVYVCLLIGMLFILPTCLIFFTNIRVFRIARKQRRIGPGPNTGSAGVSQKRMSRAISTSESDINGNFSRRMSAFIKIKRRLSSTTLTRSVTSRDIQIAVATLLLIGCYLLSWLPFVIPRMLYTFEIGVPSQLISYTPAFAFSNVLWDPFLILGCRNEIRKGVRRIYRTAKCFIFNKEDVASGQTN